MGLEEARVVAATGQGLCSASLIKKREGGTRQFPLGCSIAAVLPSLAPRSRACGRAATALDQTARQDPVSTLAPQRPRLDCPSPRTLLARFHPWTTGVKCPR